MFVLCASRGQTPFTGDGGAISVASFSDCNFLRVVSFFYHFDDFFVYFFARLLAYRGHVAFLKVAK